MTSTQELISFKEKHKEIFSRDSFQYFVSKRFDWGFCFLGINELKQALAWYENLQHNQKIVDSMKKSMSIISAYKKAVQIGAMNKMSGGYETAYLKKAIA